MNDLEQFVGHHVRVYLVHEAGFPGEEVTTVKWVQGTLALCPSGVLFMEEYQAIYWVPWENVGLIERLDLHEAA